MTMKTFESAASHQLDMEALECMSGGDLFVDVLGIVSIGFGDVTTSNQKGPINIFIGVGQVIDGLLKP
ncbi:MAG: hypothetical protein RL385_209 [Pseudomonadota bacterium]